MAEEIEVKRWAEFDRDYGQYVREKYACLLGAQLKFEDKWYDDGERTILRIALGRFSVKVTYLYLTTSYILPLQDLLLRGAFVNKSSRRENYSTQQLDAILFDRHGVPFPRPLLQLVCDYSAHWLITNALTPIEYWFGSPTTDEQELTRKLLE